MTNKTIKFSLGSLLGVLGLTILLTIGMTYSVMIFSFKAQGFTHSVLPERLLTNLSHSYTLMKNTYIGDLDEDALIDGALSGFVSATGDKYTSYLNEQEWASLQQTTDSSFEGIGVEIEKAGDYIRIVSPYDNAPAAKAGLQTNDLIIGVNGENIAGQSVTDLVNKVRGKKGTTVHLKIRRDNNEFDVAIMRDTIPLISVTHRLDESNKQIGIIRISSFSKTTYEELVEAVTDLRKQGATAFVIDVRSNPGGLLHSVEQIVNMFVDEDTVMYKMEDRAHGIQKSVASHKLGTFKVTEPVSILVNNGSASAAEIFAAALSENGRAKLVGIKTFGKGTAQSIFNLTDTTGVKITYSKWLTPNGNWIHETGIEPDYSVKLPEYSTLAIVSPELNYTLGDASDAILNMQKVLNAL